LGKRDSGRPYHRGYPEEGDDEEEEPEGIVGSKDTCLRPDAVELIAETALELSGPKDEMVPVGHRSFLEKPEKESGR